MSKHTVIVLYVMGERVASVLDNAENVDYLKKMFYLSPITVDDITNNKFYNVIGCKKEG